MVKIDLGAQINGYIADTAVTVCYDPQYDNLVQTAEDALKNAISMIKIGVKASDIGRTIEKTVKQMGFLPIANLKWTFSCSIYNPCRKIYSKHLVYWFVFIIWKRSICL